MEFKRARNDEQIANRQDEIINACYLLYSNGKYDDITFGKISEMTSISRPSIYNYYITREEVLLDVLEKEYFKWYENLKSNFNEDTRLTKKDLFELLVNSFNNSDVFLRLLSLQYNIIEKNCSFEKLTQFKMNTQSILKSLEAIVGKTFPRSAIENRSTFVLMLFSSLGSFYELCHPNDIELKAMKIATRDYKLPDFKNLLYKYVETLFETL